MQRKTVWPVWGAVGVLAIAGCETGDRDEEFRMLANVAIDTATDGAGTSDSDGTSGSGYGSDGTGIGSSASTTRGVTSFGDGTSLGDGTSFGSGTGTGTDADADADADSDADSDADADADSGATTGDATSFGDDTTTDDTTTYDTTTYDTTTHDTTSSSDDSSADSSATGLALDAGGGGGDPSCVGFPDTPPAGLCCNSNGYFWDPNSWCTASTTITSEGECIQANGGPPPFQVWLRLFLGTDQHVAIPAQNSGLVGRDGMATWVSDSDLAREFAVHFGNAKHEVRLAAYFSECFGGGMIDDIVYRFGNHPDLCAMPFALSSASRYDQTANYPAPGIDDWANGLMSSLETTGNALGLAWGAAESDGFAPGLENPQYIARNGGENIDVGAEKDRGIAILWSGRPAKLDGLQIARAIAALRNVHGWSCDRIFVFYGDGQLPPNHPIQLQRNACGGKQFVLSRAVKPQLVRLLNAAFLGGWKPSPEFVFLFANDHGYSTAVGNGVATPREGIDIEQDYDAENDPSGGEPSFPPPG